MLSQGPPRVFTAAIKRPQKRNKYALSTQRSLRDNLTRNGYPVPAAKPRRVTAEDLAGADVVISIGCDMKGLPTPRGALVKWDEVPSPSEDFAGADEAIRKRVIALVEELVRKPPQS
jgi:hypothetical protein